MNTLRRYAPVFFIIFLLLLIPASLLSSFRDGMLRLVRPVSTFLVRQSVAVSNFRQNITQISSLRGDKENLQQEVLTLRQQLASRDDVAQENETLRKELGVTGVTKSLPKALARIVVLGSDPLDRTATIDLGSDQGMKVGQPAVSQGFLIGRIIAVRANSSIVRFITSKDSRIQAWDSQNHEKGLLEGDGNTVTLSDITQGATISQHETVETSGLGGSLPQGILVGEIGQTASKKSDLSQSFSVTLAQDPASLETVFILLTDSQ